MSAVPETLENEQCFAERARQAMLVLDRYVAINPDKLGGVPLLRGTRFSIPELLSEIAEGDSTDDIADNFELDKQHIQEFLHALAVFLDKPRYEKDGCESSRFIPAVLK
jgi:uncharacterized protein (DUF433 family)